MTYGIAITPEVTNKLMEITSGCRAMSYLGYFKATEIDSNQNAVFSIPNKTAGSTIYVVPLKMSTAFNRPASSITEIAIVDNITVSGNTIIAHWNNNYKYVQTELAVFEVLGAGQSSAEYGIALSDASNYLEINSNSKIGCCVWAGTVTINGTWSVPPVQARANSVVFVNWNDAGAVLTFNDASKTISCWRHTGGSGENISLSTVTASILVFSSGFTLELPEWGLALFNSSGMCTFSSKYAPLLAAGTVSLNKTVGTWVTCPSSKPMIPVGVVGGARSVTVGKQELWHNCGVRMSGNQITGGIANYVNGSSITYRASVVTPVNFPVLDGNLYF